MSDREIAALRQVNLDWTVMLQGVWKDAPGDVPTIHQDVRADFVSAIESLAVSPATSSPAGWVIVGDGGAGKTHLLGRFRAELARRRGCFVLVDMTDVRDFWDTVLLGYFTSLQELVVGRRPQYERLIAGFLGLLKFAEPTQAIINRLRVINPTKLRPAMDKVLGTLHKHLPAEVNLNGDVIRALVALNSDDYNIANVGSAWLQGEEIESDAKKKLGMTRAREKNSNIVRGMSWLMSLSGPSVVALDQLDPIVTQLSLAHSGLESAPALAIINKVGAGLSELRDVTRRTLLVVSCVDRTWKSLKEFTPKQFTDRYNPPRILGPLNSQQSVTALLSQRLGPVYAEAGFNPPYPTWPFAEGFLQQVALDSPREILKKCQGHINECVRRGEVRELPPGWAMSASASNSRFAELDEKFVTLRAAVDVSGLLDEQYEDDRLGELIRAALRCVVQEITLPEEIDALIDETFTGGKGAKPLHARLRLVFPREQSREEHFCFRALQRKNALAFTSRLRSAMTQAGIEKALKFRRLVIVRKGAPPGGMTTSKLTRQFEEFGGLWLDPSADDLSTLEALRLMEKDSLFGFPDWLKSRQPASRTGFMLQAIPEVFTYAQARIQPAPVAEPVDFADSVAAAPAAIPNPEPAAAPSATWSDGPAPIPPTLGPSPLAYLTLGRRLIGDHPISQPTRIPFSALNKHGMIVAGAGSGKTVLLKRLIEDAALLGVPSIVIDSGDGLASIGDRSPAPPPQWLADDAGLAERFFDTSERVIWTPGQENGNPFSDPAILLGLGNQKTRISVISFEGLPSYDEQRQFVSQLAMALFSWIKDNPASAQTPLRGLLVIDEARDFVPATNAAKCVASMQKLVAQARRYGLGIILATQSPNEIDSTIVEQCATHWYGKMNSPRAIDSATALLMSRGAAPGDDVSALKTGCFYVSNADHIHPPARLMTAMCLSADASI